MLAIAHSLINLLKMVTLIALQQQVAILFLLIKSKCCFYLYVKWQYRLPCRVSFMLRMRNPPDTAVKTPES
jgi:Ca2+/Na+ antiporter